MVHVQNQGHGKRYQLSLNVLCLQIWDIAGQDHYRAMTRTYYRGASGCVVLFDITNRRSLLEAKSWKEDLDAKVALPNGDPVPCILIANKVCVYMCATEVYLKCINC